MTSTSSINEDGRESLIRHWRETQTGQSSIERMPERNHRGIPRETRSTESRNCEQNDRNFMPALKMGNQNGKYG